LFIAFVLRTFLSTADLVPPSSRMHSLRNLEDKV
jgi:hypothetical protein